VKGAVYSTIRPNVNRGDRSKGDIRRVRLSADEVHVWRASLDRSPTDVDRLHLLLAADERERATRFRFDRDRSRYVIGRGLLRLLLARYGGLAPAEIRFAYSAYEKPSLLDGGPAFNVSHSGSIAMFAFCAHGDVGIDIEIDEPDFASEQIAEHFFSPGEVAVLRSLPEAQRARAFLSCWTRKEAFIKARGDGLSLELASFDVSVAPTSEPAVLRTEWSREEPSRWCLRDLSNTELGYVAAVALRSHGWSVVGRDVPENLDDITDPEQEDK
jgi:4'-phosphopantetheinyl transferase